MIIFSMLEPLPEKYFFLFCAEEFNEMIPIRKSVINLIFILDSFIVYELQCNLIALPATKYRRKLLQNVVIEQRLYQL
jgi:hypothetical protein